jgi:hypothetical protein
MTKERAEVSWKVVAELKAMKKAPFDYSIVSS